MLGEAFAGPPAPTTSPGVNATKQLELAGGTVVFHKPFSGVHVANAIAYGQTDETPPLHEAAAWRLAVALGPPWDEIVVPCVLREYAGEDGSLSPRAVGWPRDPAPTLNPTWCFPAAFFDSLIAQQDRHGGNWRWDGERLTLIDHGYAFALPRPSSTTPTSSLPATGTGPRVCSPRSMTRSVACSATPTCSEWRGSCCPTARRRWRTGQSRPDSAPCRAPQRRPQARRLPALHWRGVDEQQVVFDPGPLAGEQAHQPLQRVRRPLAALVPACPGIRSCLP